MSILGLPQATALESGDQIPLGDYSEGADRRASLSLLAAYLQTQLSGGSREQSQYSAPDASGASVTVAPLVNGGSVWLQFSPTAAYAACTIILPALSTLVEGQELLVTSSQAITTVTINGNGANVSGAPSGLTQHGFFRLRYTSIGTVWRRIG